MKLFTAALMTAACLVSASAFASGQERHDHSKHAGMGGTVHEEVVDGVKAGFTVQTMKEAMKSMGMELPKGVTETHHISLTLTEVKNGRIITEGEARLKVIGPDKTDQTRDLMAMHGHFGADVAMVKKGTYGIMCKFKTADGRTRQTRFWYTVK